MTLPNLAGVILAGSVLRADVLTSFFGMRKKPTSQFGMGPLKRFIVRTLQPFLLRPFEGAAEKRSLTDGLKQIARTLRAMGVSPEDPIAKQIGSEFQLLFCGAAPAGKMKSQPRSTLIDPVESISDLLRKPPPRIRSTFAAAALRRFVALCRRPNLSRLRRSSL